MSTTQTFDNLNAARTATFLNDVDGDPAAAWIDATDLEAGVTAVTINNVPLLRYPTDTLVFKLVVRADKWPSSVQSVTIDPTVWNAGAKAMLVCLGDVATQLGSVSADVGDIDYITLERLGDDLRLSTYNPDSDVRTDIATSSGFFAEGGAGTGTGTGTGGTGGTGTGGTGGTGTGTGTGSGTGTGTGTGSGNGTGSGSEDAATDYMSWLVALLVFIAVSLAVWLSSRNKRK